MPDHAPSAPVVKRGARHSTADQHLLQQAHDALHDLGAECDTSPQDAPDMGMSFMEYLASGKSEGFPAASPDDALVMVGDAVRAVAGDGRVGGYLVRWGNPTERDSYGEYFTADTYLGRREGNGADVLYHHGLVAISDDDLGGLEDKLLGELSTRRDATGLWGETQLDLTDPDARRVYAKVKRGGLFWSSGSAPHMVRMDGDGRITRWPIIEGSLTPIPAERRDTNRVHPLRSLTLVSHGDAIRAASDYPLSSAHLPFPAPHSTENTPMSETQVINSVGPVNPTPAPVPVPVPAPVPVDIEAIKVAVKAELAAEAQAKVEAEAKRAEAEAKDALVTALKAQVDELMSIVKNAPAVKNGGVAVPDGKGIAITPPQDTEEYRNAFKSFLHSGVWPADAQAIRAALNEGTVGQGGYLVPTLYSNELVVPLANMSFMRQAGARIMSVTGTNAFDVPNLTFSAAASLTTEANAYSETEPTTGHVTFNPYKFTKLSKASEEVVADSRFDIWSQILQPDYLQAFAAAENTYLTTGTGSSQPQGVVAGATTGVTAASASAIVADELINLYHALDFKYRPNAKWMMHDSTLQAVKKLKDSTGNYLWGNGLNGGQEGMLLGKPVVVNTSMAAIGTGNKSVLFGDFSYYWIADWQELAVQRLVELYAANGQVGFRALKRLDGHVMLAAAFQVIAHP